MQIVLNGTACRPLTLGDDLVWSIVERLETYGWTRQAVTGRTVCLVK